MVGLLRLLVFVHSVTRETKNTAGSILRAKVPHTWGGHPSLGPADGCRGPQDSHHPFRPPICLPGCVCFGGWQSAPLASSESHSMSGRGCLLWILFQQPPPVEEGLFVHTFQPSFGAGRTKGTLPGPGPPCGHLPGL